MDNKCNEFLSTFTLLNKEFSLGNHLCDNFPDHFSFYSHFYNVKNQLCKLDNVIIVISLDPSACIIISDASIKNHIAISILYVYSSNWPIIKIYHQDINVSTTEAKLFAIRCGINQTIGILYIKHIVVITDSLHAAKKIFNSSLYSYQIHSAAIACKLREFFNKDTDNHIEFWDCPSKKNQHLHSVVNKNTRSFKALVSFPCKSSWSFSKKHFCNNIISQQKTLFQISDLKERNFLELLDSDSYSLVPSNINGGLWL